MPWRLIVFLLSLLVLLVFAGFNMNNASDISFGFHELTDVPIFVSLLFSFILGVLFALPFAYIGKKTSVKKKKPEDLPHIAKPQKKGLFTDKIVKKDWKSKKAESGESGNSFEKPEDII